MCDCLGKGPKNIYTSIRKLTNMSNILQTVFLLYFPFVHHQAKRCTKLQTKGLTLSGTNTLFIQIKMLNLTLNKKKIQFFHQRDEIMSVGSEQQKTRPITMTLEMKTHHLTPEFFGTL